MTYERSADEEFKFSLVSAIDDLTKEVRKIREILSTVPEGK